MDDEPEVSDAFGDMNGLRPGTWELMFVNNSIKVIDVARFMNKYNGGVAYAVEKDTNRIYNWSNVISALRVGN